MKENTGADMCEMCSLTCLRGLVVYGTETKACEVRGGTPVFCIFNLILSYEVIISQSPTPQGLLSLELTRYLLGLTCSKCFSSVGIPGTSDI